MAQALRLPDLFIVGAPKCGTTALFAYLSHHPDVFVPERKEPHYFGTDLEFRLRRRPSLDAYASLYAGATAEQRALDGSVWYLYSRRAATEIHHARPDARILIMLRNPVDMMYSLHSQFLHTGNEDIEDFGEALEAEVDRAQGLRIPRMADFVAGLQYRATARFANQVQRYLDAFGSDRVHTILLDDLAANPSRVYAQTLQFLGLPPFQPQSFARVNPNTRPRNLLLRNLLISPPNGVRRLVRATVPHAIRHRLYHAAASLNARRVARTALDTRLRRQLTQELAGDVADLSALLGRDLSAWRDL